MNNYKDVIVLKRILNFSDIIENVYSVVESELFWWVKLLLFVYLIAIANRDYAIFYWIKNRYIK